MKQLRCWHLSALKVISDPMSALARTSERDGRTRTTNENCTANESWTRTKYAYVRNNPVSLTDPTGLDFYLTCQQNKDNGSTCQGGHVGTSDDKGNFTATVVTSDSIRNGDNSATVGPNGVEVTTGGKTYTGEYFENPDSIKMKNVNGESTFVDHNQITLGGKAGSGLENFSFFVNGNW